MKIALVNEIYCSPTFYLNSSFREKDAHFRIFVAAFFEVNFLRFHVLQYSVQWNNPFPLNATPLFILLQGLVLSTVE